MKRSGVTTISLKKDIGDRRNMNDRDERDSCDGKAVYLTFSLSPSTNWMETRCWKDKWWDAPL